MPFLLLANVPELTLFDKLTTGATGIALGMIIVLVGVYFYQVRHELPRKDADRKDIRELTDAVNEMSRSIWTLISGSNDHTEASKDEARKAIARIDSRKKP